MKKLLPSALILIVGALLLFWGIGQAFMRFAPPYKDALGDDTHTQKIKGLYLLKESAAREDNLILYGSSELRTFDVSTHPVHFFSEKRTGFQVNLVGRGSCQSIIHALSIAASGDALAGKKIVLITSPQSYVEGGIAPDLFMANFSSLQFTEMMHDPSIPTEIKEYFCDRFQELKAEYFEKTGMKLYADAAVGQMADQNPLKDFFLAPFYAFSNWLEHLKDLTASIRLIESIEGESVLPVRSESVDWVAESEKAEAEAVRMTDNNEFGILNDYYTTYVGRKLAQQKDKDAALSYSVSKEYADLKVLLDLCVLKGIEPLFVHVPLHGAWSDYTGFTAERRTEYYRNVNQVLQGYEQVQVLDLTGYEYEPYFMSDVMHLGWKGWLAFDQAIDRFVHQR